MLNEYKNAVNGLIEGLIADYEQKRDIDIIDTATPNRCEVIKILGQLRCLIFPGYFKCGDSSIKDNVSSLMLDISDSLSRQIAIALKYLPKYGGADKAELLAAAEGLTVQFLGKLTAIRQLLQTDLQAAYDGDPAAFNKAEIVLAYPGLYAIMVSRIAHELYLLGIPLIPRIMTEHAHTQTGIDIHPGASIGEYFFIDHGTGIVIGETSVIGKNVKIYQGVTIGALSTRGGHKLGGTKRHPTIEDNVTIYTGASILGGNTIIGSNSVIGSNVFITSSVPSNTKLSKTRNEK